MSSSSAPHRGLFIVLEGLDRSGKSTQVQKLVENLQSAGRPARLQKFPDRTTAIGKMIDSYLQSNADLDDRAVHLLFSANRWETVAQLEAELASGTSIVADRYAFSGIAFSAAKGLPFDFCLNPDSGLPLPDITIYLKVSPETAAKRSEYGSERYETIDMQQKVREQFDLVGEEVLNRHGRGKWEEVDAAGAIDSIAGKISTIIGAVSASENLGRLWT